MIIFFLGVMIGFGIGSCFVLYYIDRNFEIETEYFKFKSQKEGGIEKNETDRC